MTFSEFDRFQEELLKEVVHMKDTKGKEYANSESRFANFDRLSVRLRLSNLQIALVYLTKHMDAIESYINKGRIYSTETIRGRIVDTITYLTLIGGMIAEREEVTQQPKEQIVASNLDNKICRVCSKIFKPGEMAVLVDQGAYIHFSCGIG